jgi:hypothetical protein
MTVDEMRVDEMSVYKMIVNERSVHETVLDKMTYLVLIPSLDTLFRLLGGGSAHCMMEPKSQHLSSTKSTLVSYNNCHLVYDVLSLVDYLPLSSSEFGQQPNLQAMP